MAMYVCNVIIILIANNEIIAMYVMANNEK